MGLWQLCAGQLASADLADAHARLPMVRPEAVGTSPDECRATHNKYTFVVPGVEEDDRGDVAQLFGGCIFWLASLACGICGMGGGEEGRFKRDVLSAHNLGIRLVREGEVGCAVEHPGQRAAG